MTYQEWFDEHAKKHRIIIDKLHSQNFSKQQIIDYFEFSNMLVHEKDFCLLYQDAKKCHEIEYLNCYFCACPHFRFNDKGISKENSKTKYSFCSIDSKEGKLGVYADAIHQDCSKCTIPHAKNYIEQRFTPYWDEAMKECKL